MREKRGSLHAHTSIPHTHTYTPIHPPTHAHTETQGRCGRQRSSIKACHSTGLEAWLGNSFYCRKNIFYAERIGKWNINVRKVESKASNWDERKYRETAGAGGRIEKHVRVLSLRGKALLGLGCGKDFHGEAQRSLRWHRGSKGGVVGQSLQQPGPLLQRPRFIAF